RGPVPCTHSQWSSSEPPAPRWFPLGYVEGPRARMRTECLVIQLLPCAQDLGRLLAGSASRAHYETRTLRNFVPLCRAEAEDRTDLQKNCSGTFPWNVREALRSSSPRPAP